MTTWILVADACGARLFMTFDNGKSLDLLERFSHAQSRSMEAQLVSDRPGSARSSTHSMPSSKAPHITHKELEAIEFSRLLNDYLREAIEHSRFDSLVLVAPPHFLGLLRDQLSPIVARTVSASVGKDLVYLDREAISQHLAKALRPAATN